MMANVCWKAVCVVRN